MHETETIQACGQEVCKEAKKIPIILSLIKYLIIALTLRNTVPGIEIKICLSYTLLFYFC